MTKEVKPEIYKCNWGYGQVSVDDKTPPEKLMQIRQKATKIQGNCMEEKDTCRCKIAELLENTFDEN